MCKAAFFSRAIAGLLMVSTACDAAYAARELDVYRYTIVLLVDGHRFAVETRDGTATAPLTVNGVMVRVVPGTSHEGRDFFGQVDVTDLKSGARKLLTVDAPADGPININFPSGHHVAVTVTNIRR